MYNHRGIKGQRQSLAVTKTLLFRLSGLKLQFSLQWFLNEQCQSVARMRELLLTSATTHLRLQNEFYTHFAGVITLRLSSYMPTPLGLGNIARMQLAYQQQVQHATLPYQEMEIAVNNIMRYKQANGHYRRLPTHTAIPSMPALPKPCEDAK